MRRTWRWRSPGPVSGFRRSRASRAWHCKTRSSTSHVPTISSGGAKLFGIIRPRVGLNATLPKAGSRWAGCAGRPVRGLLHGPARLGVLQRLRLFRSGLARRHRRCRFRRRPRLPGCDPETKSILLYVEGISDARSFMSGLRVAARLKPVIVVKSGRNESGSRAAVSHTGALIGSDDVSMRRYSARRGTRHHCQPTVRSRPDLASGTRVEGPRLAILTNGGGPGVMAADRASDLEVPLPNFRQRRSKGSARSCRNIGRTATL